MFTRRLAYVLAAVGVTAACSGSPTADPTPTTAPTTSTAFVAPVDVAFHTTGTGSRVVVLVHGGPGKPDPHLTTLLQSLTASGLQLVSYNQRGVGGSPQPQPTPGTYGPDAYVADLEHLRERLGVDTLDLVGESWGGMVVSLYTAAHPDRVRHVAVMDGEPLDPTARQAIFDAFDGRLKELQGSGAVPPTMPNFSDCVAVMTAVAPVYAPNPAAYAAYRETLVPANNDDCADGQKVATWTYTDLTVQAARVAELEDRLRQWTGKAMVIEGERDPFGPSMQSADVGDFPKAQLTAFVIPNAGHVPLLDDPTLVGRIRDFLGS